MPRIIASLLVFATFVAAPLASSAAVITVPTDLIPGQSYRLAFVTSSTTLATSTNIADYNAFVAAVAAGQTELAALGTTWTAIASTAAVDARDNTGTNPSSTGVPIYRLDDTRIANDNVDLWDATLAAPILLEQTGVPAAFGTRAWTGTLTTGAADPVQPLGATAMRIGVAGSDNFAWIINGSSQGTAGTERLYGMSGVLTVIPEPSTMVLACFGATAVVGWQFRRRRHRKRQALLPLAFSRGAR